MNAIRKSILLAVDGSDRSHDAVRYASKILNPEKTHVVLFHVMWKIDQAFWDMGINPIQRINHTSTMEKASLGNR